MKKRYLKTRPLCRVCFELPKEAVANCKKVCVVGEFNNWNTRATPLKRRKDGSFAVTIDLPTGREYQFRYLLDGTVWENDWNADKYVPTCYEGYENSVVVV